MRKGTITSIEHFLSDLANKLDKQKDKLVRSFAMSDVLASQRGKALC